MDIFVDILELDKLGFKEVKVKKEGRPGFEPVVFLKLYLYGYYYGIRSSRKLERETARNIELHWLLEKLVPNYHSIADFRKENPLALKNVFKLFVLFLKECDLVDGDVGAVDGTKVRAHNSKKNNYNPKKIERHLEYIDKKTAQYFEALEENDHAERNESLNDVEDKIVRLKHQRLSYELLGKQMEESGEPQVSTTDPDSRALLVHGQVVEVTYNVQAAVDQKHKLVVATHTINRNDRNALSAIALEAKANLSSEKMTLLADKGYHNGREIQICEDNQIETIVAHSVLVNSNDHGTTAEFMVDKFIYNSESDTYTCPVDETLTTQGTWHKKSRSKNSSYQFKKYRTPACAACAVRHLCTGRKQGGREIERSEYADAVDANRKRYHENPELYRKRQEINEHIFGTIKRVWGFGHTNLKGLKKVNGEFSFIMMVYNFKRVLNILGIKETLEKLKNWKPNYDKIGLPLSNLTLLTPNKPIQHFFLNVAA